MSAARSRSANPTWPVRFRGVAMDAETSWLILAISAIIALIALPRRAGLDLQCIVIGFAIVVLLTFDGCIGEEYDPGGNPALTMAKVSDARRRGADSGASRPLIPE